MRLIDADALKKKISDVYENKTTATIKYDEPLEGQISIFE